MDIVELETAIARLCALMDRPHPPSSDLDGHPIIAWRREEWERRILEVIPEKAAERAHATARRIMLLVAEHGPDVVEEAAPSAADDRVERPYWFSDTKKCCDGPIAMLKDMNFSRWTSNKADWFVRTFSYGRMLVVSGLMAHDALPTEEDWLIRLIEDDKTTHRWRNNDPTNLARFPFSEALGYAIDAAKRGPHEEVL